MLNETRFDWSQAAGAAAEPPLSGEQFADLRIIALLPFLVKGALSLTLFRALRALGAEIVVAPCAYDTGGYTRDSGDDFSRDNCLLDLTSVRAHLQLEFLRREITERRLTLAIQLGAFSLYPLLPYLKEQLPTLRFVDILYNEIGHTINHFLYEACFDGVIVESQYMARYIREGSLKPDPRVCVIESGVDLDYFNPGEPRDNPAELRIGYVGRLSGEKNPIGFIDMFEHLAERMHDLSAVIVGNGPMVEEVRRRVADSPVATRLAYLERLDSIVDTLQGLDALFVPSIVDGRPNVIMEANACGVPVIAAPVGGIPEMIEPGVNGYLARPTDFDRVEALLRAWVADPPLRRLMRSSSRHTAESRFDRRRMIEDYAVAFRRFGGSRAGLSGNGDAQRAF